MKYRHHGYKDDEYDKERKPAQQQPKKKKDDGMPPRSRLAEKRMATLVFRCHNCGRQGSAPESIAKDAACEGCGQALHSCMNCMQFDPGARMECREPRLTAAVFSKRASNECEYFSPKSVLDSTGRRQDSARPATARQAFDDLFKK
jgi:hypothetical protein